MFYGKLITRICRKMIRYYHTYDVIIKFFFFAKSFTFCKTTQITTGIVKFFKTTYKI